MKFSPATASKQRHPLIVFARDKSMQSLPTALRKALLAGLEREAVTSCASLGSVAAEQVIAVKQPDWRDRVAVRRRGGAIAKAVRKLGATEAQLTLPARAREVDLLLTGFAQGAYQWTRYQPSAPPPFKRLRVLGAPTGACLRASKLAACIDSCRDLLNTPTADLGPADFVREARRLCRNSGLQIRLLDEKHCLARGMGCLTAVGRAAAADRRPRLLIIDWPGKKGKGSRKSDRLALCGKGVCFDTGGLQIKPGKSMELMRKDMGGAATVLAAMLSIADTKAPRAVRAYLPLVENAIDGSAFRPGDILTAMDGTTVEVGHTDAEGRLILADAICLAREEGATEVVTVATLTGAAMIALGRIHVPIMGTDPVVKQLEQAGAAAGEKVWRLPLDEDHVRAIKSKVATITNSAGPEASCITAGAFLQHFAKDTAFGHCDISPCSWMPGDHALGPAGATGVLVDSLRRLAD